MSSASQALLLIALLGALAGYPMRSEAAGFGPPVLADGDWPPMRLYPEQVQAIGRQAHPPEVTAESALVVDLDSGRELFAKEPDKALAPASTVKLMTALVVMDEAALDDEVTVSDRAASTEGSRMGLDPGQKVTVRELLFGLLLPSGNDAAVALAEHVAGSEEAFVSLMNAKAAGLGLKQTLFRNVHGLDDPEQRTSVRDLVVITEAAFSYAVLAEIVATASAQVAGRTLTNTNELLATYPGADGVKTGTTDLAGECLVASAKRDGHRLLAVVLGSRSRFADSASLLDWARAGWGWQRVSLPDDALAWEIGPDGAPYRLWNAQPLDAFLSEWERPMAQSMRALDAGVPYTGTLPVGELRLMLGADVLGRSPLTVLQSP